MEVSIQIPVGLSCYLGNCSDYESTMWTASNTTIFSSASCRVEKGGGHHGQHFEGSQKGQKGPLKELSITWPNL